MHAKVVFLCYVVSDNRISSALFLAGRMKYFKKSLQELRMAME